MKRKFTHVKIKGVEYPLPENWDNYWLAQDKNGDWFLFSNKPEVYIGYNCIWHAKATRKSRVHFLCRETPPKDFTQELYELY